MKNGAKKTTRRRLQVAQLERSSFWLSLELARQLSAITFRQPASEQLCQLQSLVAAGLTSVPGCLFLQLRHVQAAG